MDRLRSWRSSRPVGRAGAWRACLTALATAALAVLLAVLFHLDVAAVAVAILGSLPTAYLGWRALPGSKKKPTYERLVRRWNPLELGVHQVIGGGPMPVYIRRPHDELLRAVLDPAVRDSRLVVVRGGSSTGKTRTAYEAVADRLSDWQLDYPLDPGALAARLEAGIPARTVLWLGELRQYADADADGGPAVLGRLADLLQGEGHLVITTMWLEHWTTYTGAAHAGSGAADPAGTAGRLLTRLPELTGRDPARIDPAIARALDRSQVESRCRALADAENEPGRRWQHRPSALTAAEHATRSWPSATTSTRYGRHPRPPTRSANSCCAPAGRSQDRNPP